jgi:hypothetical protein
MADIAGTHEARFHTFIFPDDPTTMIAFGGSSAHFWSNSWSVTFFINQ